MSATSTIEEPRVATKRDGRKTESACFHCETDCGDSSFRADGLRFCCQGCLAVNQLLSENGLGDFYSIDRQAGVRIGTVTAANRFAFLDAPSVREGMVNFANERMTRVTWRLPAIHCMACVWLLENLFKLREGIGHTEVNFLRKEATITFETATLKLSDLAALLASLGYDPDFRLADLDTPKDESKAYATPRKLWMQIGVAGFAFGNNMLFSIASYLGLDGFHGPAVQKLVGYLSFGLAIPVLLYSAQDYFRLAVSGLRRRLLTIEAPIALGIIVIFAQSAYEVITATGEGYFDSFAGLLFLLLCGRLFQQKTYSRLAFDRDYKSFFPLAITRIRDGVAESVALSLLKSGDRLLVRNGELMPADARLVNGDALIDYSFVTGEAEPVKVGMSDRLYAGGRQIGGAIQIETIKAVSQSYLTSLWNQDAFAKRDGERFDTLINQYSERFTRIILGLACAVALYWWIVDASITVKAFTSVLIVACPCALALAAPFTLGAALRILSRNEVFVKSTDTLERMAKVSSIVFDKTGTLTGAGSASINFHGMSLSKREQSWVATLARQSTHPHAVQIASFLCDDGVDKGARSFVELPGRGIEGVVDGRRVMLGSAAWLQGNAIPTPDTQAATGSVVHLAIDGMHRGFFALSTSVRSSIDTLIAQLSAFDLALLSGDNSKSRQRFETLLGERADLRFNQTPLDKLEFVRSQQQAGRKVMMVGDGLNDAGALKQSDVGIAVVEKIGAFSPASDVIMVAEMVPQLGAVLQFSKGAVTIVHASFLISTLYNVIGLAIAAQGKLSPIVCAILMPLSSISVVAFACLATAWWGKRVGLSQKRFKNA